MKIIDCTTFFEEHMMMDVRFNILNNYVDKFIVCEATFSHSGQKKKINFNPSNYPKFKKKIIHIIMDKDPCIYKKKYQVDLTNREKSIVRIAEQRNFIGNFLDDFSDEDIVIHSDNDEIPDLRQLNFKVENDNIFIFEQKLFYYKFNLLYANFSWFGSKACKIKTLKSFDWLRNIKNKKYNFFRLDTLFSKTKYRNIKIVNNGGWHFSNLKSVDELLRKYNNDENFSEFLEKKIQKQNIKDFIDRKVHPHNHFVDKASKNKSNEYNLTLIDENDLPEYIKINKKKYIQWFAN